MFLIYQNRRQLTRRFVFAAYEGARLANIISNKKKTHVSPFNGNMWVFACC